MCFVVCSLQAVVIFEVIRGPLFGLRFGIAVQGRPATDVELGSAPVVQG
jgi:hypothetical protein